MSVLNLQKSESFEPDRRQPVLVPSQTFGDVAEASFESFKRNWNIGAEDQAMFGEVEERDSTYEKEFGESIYKSAGTFDVRKFTGRNRLPKEKIDEANNIVESFLRDKRKTDPDIFSKFKSREDLNEVVRQKALQAAANEQKVKAGATGGVAFTGGLVGSLGASLLDPINLLTLPIGAGAARGIVKTALIEGAINMGVETISQPFVADWQKELGREYGFTEMVENVGVAGVFGFAFGGAIKTASKVVGLDRTARVYGELGDMEAAGAAKYLSREAHLNENAIYKADNGFEYDNFVEAVTELNSAIKEGRRVNHSKLSIDVDSMMGVDLKKVKDPILRANVEEFQDLYRGIDKDVVIVEAPVARVEVKEVEAEFSKKTKFDEESGELTFGKEAEANLSHANEDMLEELAPGLSDKVGGEAVELRTLEVSPKAQGTGVGSKALKEVDIAARKMGSDTIVLKAEPLSSQFVGKAVPEKLPDLIRFYEKNGFKVFKRNADNAIMVKRLGEAPVVRPKVSPGKPTKAVQPETTISRGKETINEILSDPLDVETPNIRVQKEISDLNNSPQAVKQELADFEEVFKGKDGMKFFDEELGREISVAEMRSQFKEDADFVKAIKTCGVGA